MKRQIFHAIFSPTKKAYSDFKDDIPRNRVTNNDRLNGDVPENLDSPIKVEAEGKPVQDKKKGVTLRKLFTKRDTEGAKGGGKGGAKGGKGGKGKAGVDIIYVGGDYERSSSSLEDETVPTNNPVPISTLPLGEEKKTCAISPSSKRDRFERIPEGVSVLFTLLQVRLIKRNKHFQASLMVKIDLKKLDLNLFSYLVKPSKRRSEELRQSSQLSNTRQDGCETLNETKQCDSDCEVVETNDRTVVSLDSDSESRKVAEQQREEGKTNKKRKRLNSTSSVSSLSTVSSLSQSSSMRRNASHRKDKGGHKSKRRKGEGNSENTPPTNHERPDVEETPPVTTVGEGNAMWTTSPPQQQQQQQQQLQRVKQYYSYFEQSEEPSRTEK